MTAFVGRDVLLEYAIADENATLGSLTFKRLGMMRGKEMSVDWDTTETTADMSPAFTKTNLVTFKQVKFSGDGVSYSDLVFNQKEFAQQCISPALATASQPKAWLRMTDILGVWVGPFIVTSWKDSRPYADAATWSMEAMSNGDVTYG